MDFLDNESEKRFYKTKEVGELLGISPRTVRDWIYKIEKRTEFRFVRKIDMRNPWYVNGKPRPQLFLDESDVELLQKIKKARDDGMNIYLVIDKIFLLPEDFEVLYPSELRIERD